LPKRHPFILLVVPSVIFLLCTAVSLRSMRRAELLQTFQCDLARLHSEVLAQGVFLDQLIKARQQGIETKESEARSDIDESSRSIVAILDRSDSNAYAIAVLKRYQAGHHGLLAFRESWGIINDARSSIVSGRGLSNHYDASINESLKFLWDVKSVQSIISKHIERLLRYSRRGIWLGVATVLASLGSAIWLFQRKITGEIRLISNRLLLAPGSSAAATRSRASTPRELAEELNVLFAQLEKANQAKDTFFATMSHEIRTPLNGVVGFLANLGETPLNPQQKQYLRIIESSARSLMHVINDVLDYSKLSSGKFELEELAFDLRAMAEDRIALARQLAKPKNLRVELDIKAPEALIIRSDPTRLRQVLDNLLSNAVKFTDHGGISLSIQATEVVDGRLSLAFAVEDSGVGIPHDLQGKLFQPYAQADKRVFRQHGGTGLGLSISASILQLLGSSLSLRSRPGEGSCFSFTISCAVAKPEEQVRLSGHFRVILPRQGLKKHLALLVDDTATNLFLLETICQNAGLPYMTAQNGQEALELCRKQRFDLIFMDIQMPVMDGYTAIREIRKLPNSGMTHIIALTASAFQEDVEKALGAGSTGFIPKPFERDQLLLAIADALGINAQREMRENHDLLESEEDSQVRRMHDFMRERYQISLGEIKMILAQTVADWRIMLDNLGIYAKRSNWEDSRAILHRLKGQLSSIGLLELSNRSAAIMECIGVEEDEKVLESVQELIHELTKIFRALEQDVTVISSS
jgi:signal transduction histidine kinase/DNA-binding response OmpR family regulator